MSLMSRDPRTMTPATGAVARERQVEWTLSVVEVGEPPQAVVGWGRSARRAVEVPVTAMVTTARAMAPAQAVWAGL